MATPGIRFCSSFDATRIAFAVGGNGPPLVRAPHWLSHLEHEFESPVWKRWIGSLSAGHRLLRMDSRACGLSDWEVAEITFEASLRDLEAVVDAAQFTRFALFGHSQGAAVALEYAARHPERVSHLVILGGYARGVMHRGLSAEQMREYEALVELVAAGWGREDASYRQMFALQFIPDATPEQLASMSELQRAASSPANATRIIRSYYTIDVRASAPRVRCPTLVMHTRGDRRVPFEEGRLIASLVPGARLVPLEGNNHILLPQEPAFAEFFRQLAGFVPGSAPGGAARDFAGLTGREADVLERIARGMDNTAIAADLAVSEKTVRNNITRIFDKLGVKNRSEAIVLARDQGFGKA